MLNLKRSTQGDYPNARIGSIHSRAAVAEVVVHDDLLDGDVPHAADPLRRDAVVDRFRRRRGCPVKQASAETAGRGCDCPPSSPHPVRPSALPTAFIPRAISQHSRASSVVPHRTSRAGKTHPSGQKFGTLGGGNQQHVRGPVPVHVSRPLHRPSHHFPLLARRYLPIICIKLNTPSLPEES